MRGSQISYKILCFPDSRDLEREVNLILKENPNTEIELPSLQIAEKYARGTESICPKCGGQIIQSNPLFECVDCKRKYTEAEKDKNERTTFTRAGNFFIQNIILRASA